jgi:hypothetical protein
MSLEGDSSRMVGKGDGNSGGVAACSGTSSFGAARSIVFAAALAANAASFAAAWATYPVDDSLSQVQAGAAQLRWRDRLPTRDAGDALDATMQVRVVLNVAAWVGAPARIYMVMPPIAPSNLTVQWATAGTLLPGRLSGGQRQLVYQGVIPSARIEDTLRVLASTDAADPATPLRVRFTFEIETPSR